MFLQGEYKMFLFKLPYFGFKEIGWGTFFVKCFQGAKTSLDSLNFCQNPLKVRTRQEIVGHRRRRKNQHNYNHLLVIFSKNENV